MLCWNGLQIWGFRVTLKMKEAFPLLLCLPWASPSGPPQLSSQPQHQRMGLWVWRWAALCWHWFLTWGLADTLSGTTPLCTVGWHSFARVATTNHHNWMALNNRNICVHSSGGWKSKTRVLTGRDPSGSSDRIPFMSLSEPPVTSLAVLGF